MKLECQACGFLGEPAQVLARPEGVAVVCGQCGVESLIAASEPEPAAPPSASVVEVEAPDGDAPAAPEAREPGEIQGAGGFFAEPLRVSPGKGPMRCPKCGYRQEMAESCVRCGLSSPGLDEPISSWRGDVPPGGESAADGLDEAWKVLIEGGLSGQEQACGAFIQQAHEAALLDRASRLIRLYAQDHAGSAEGEAAVEMLGSVIRRSHAAFLLVEGGGGRDQMIERTQLIMKGLYLLVAVGALLALITICWVWMTG